MDDGSLLISARLSGARTEYECPIEISLYGTSHPYHKEILRVRMQSDRIDLSALNKREREVKKSKADNIKREKEREKEKRQRERAEKPHKTTQASQRKEAEFKKACIARTMAMSNGMDGSNNPASQMLSGLTNSAGPSSKEALPKPIAVPTKTLEEIQVSSERFNPRDLSQIPEKYGTDEKTLARMPEADQPERIVTQLLPYQRQGLAWLLEQEHPRVPPPGSTEIVQLWKHVPGQSYMFMNIATNHSQMDVPTLASGGILADDMGLGKTLQMISLIAADPPDPFQTAAWSSATLIITPVSVMSNWEGQVSMPSTAHLGTGAN